jgi:hypothetical protein
MNIKNTMCRLSDLTKEQIDRIVEALPDSGYFDFGVHEHFIGFNIAGSSGTFTKVSSLKIISYTEMMQLIGKTMKEFTKSDLKTGMFVKYRGGHYRVVIGDFLSGKGCASLSQYSDNLKYVGDTYKALDIMAVYKASGGTNMDEYLSGQRLTLIWERTEQTPAQKEMEVLQAKMDELQEQMKVVQAKL